MSIGQSFLAGKVLDAAKLWRGRRGREPDDVDPPYEEASVGAHVSQLAGGVKRNPVLLSEPA
jgi:hypothetical protein